jgi:hypothetical protein
VNIQKFEYVLATNKNARASIKKQVVGGGERSNFPHPLSPPFFYIYFMD